MAATLEPTRSTDAPLFAWVEGAAGEVVGAALRTPPRRLLVSTMSPAAAGALMAKLLEVDRELPGVNGPQPAASHAAQAWRSCAGGAVTPLMSQAIYWLEHVQDPPRPPAGRLRPADQSDRDLMIDWTHAFNRNAGLPDVAVESEVDRRLRDRRMFVWSDGRETVSMVGTAPPVAGVVRLGPVHTPPDRRRRGYATALVAEVSRRALAAGAAKCMLYTDLANATSNSIYQAVGYRRSSDAQEYAFSSHDLE